MLIHIKLIEASRTPKSDLSTRTSGKCRVPSNVIGSLGRIRVCLWDPGV